MKTHPIVILCCVALGTYISILVISKLQQGPNLIEISVLDGSGVSAREVLNSAYSLSSESPVAIRFRTHDNDSITITAMSRRTVSNLPCDWMAISLHGSRMSMNDEVLSGDLLRSRLATYAESSRLVDALPFVLVSADADTSGGDLVSLFAMLRGGGVSLIIPTYTPQHSEQDGGGKVLPSASLRLSPTSP